jgi:hypothetical protein
MLWLSSRHRSANAEFVRDEAAEYGDSAADEPRAGDAEHERRAAVAQEVGEAIAERLPEERPCNVRGLGIRPDRERNKRDVDENLRIGGGDHRHRLSMR